MVEYKRVVLKFGGSVLSDFAAYTGVANLIRQILTRYKVVAVIVSAMGKTTNNLDTLAHNMSDAPTPRELDALLATGEMQSAALLAMKLNSIGVSARSYNAWQCGIKTDDNFGCAKINNINLLGVNPLLGIPVVTGFQGVTKQDDITTLGREGSDISAVFMAYTLYADFCWFFKDGGGIYDKNPNKDKDARLFKEISYTKMLDLLNQGRGQVLHQRSVKLAQEYKMPLYVSGMNNLDVGTWIVPRVHSKTH